MHGGSARMPGAHRPLHRAVTDLLQHRQVDVFLVQHDDPRLGRRPMARAAISIQPSGGRRHDGAVPAQAAGLLSLNRAGTYTQPTTAIKSLTSKCMGERSGVLAPHAADHSAADFGCRTTLSAYVTLPFGALRGHLPRPPASFESDVRRHKYVMHGW